MNSLLDTEAVRTDLQAGGRILKSWGEAIETRRDQLGIDLEAFAKLCDTSSATIRRVELGMLCPRDYLRMAIAAALGTTPSALFVYPNCDELNARYIADEAIAC